MSRSGVLVLVAEDVLLALWQASGLASRLNSRSLAGGPDGARADRALDAVLALFTEAAKLSDRSPGSGVAQLHDWVRQLQITDTTSGRPGTGEEVSILTAHASKGLEWQVVCVAGVQDARFQQLMPDVIHWLGIRRIDRFVSMSNMKHDALTKAGVAIGERVPIPDSLVPPDASVEIEAKKAAGYFSPETPPSEADLKTVVGRDLEDF